MSKQRSAQSRGVYWQVVGSIVAVALVASPAANLARTVDASNAAPRVALSIETDPAGPAAYVDGQFAGQTPVQVGELVPGDHRVRVVKDGYLENSRVVSLADRTNVVQVKLTRATGTDAAAITAAPGGSSNKWLWIGIAGGGAAAAVAAVALTKNAAPTVSTVTPSATTALLGGAGIGFSANGADKDNDAITYNWDFGDGGTDTGATPTHTFVSAGTFTVKVTVSDSKHKNAASATASIVVKSLTGVWRGTLNGSRANFATNVSLTQSGGGLTGGYTDQFPGSGTVAGSVKGSSPIVTFTVTISGVQPFTFTGNPSGDINTLTGQANGSGFVNAPWTIARQ